MECQCWVLLLLLIYSKPNHGLFLKHLVDEKILANHPRCYETHWNPLKPYSNWDILIINNCCNCRISETSPHTTWLMQWWICFTLRWRRYWKGATHCHLGIWDSSSQSTMAFSTGLGGLSLKKFSRLQWRLAATYYHRWVKCNLYAENVSQCAPRLEAACKL